VTGEVSLMEKRGRAAVVVLGDIGRSPRMQYHALSLAKQVSSLSLSLYIFFFQKYLDQFSGDICAWVLQFSYFIVVPPVKFGILIQF
jgi:hypothetical protein